MGCWDKLKDTDLHNLLKKRTGFDDPSTPEGKEAYRKAAQDIQNENLNKVHSIYNKVGVKGYEQPEQKAETPVTTPQETTTEKRLFHEGGDLFNKIDDIKKSLSKEGVVIESNSFQRDLDKMKEAFKPIIDEIKKETGKETITLYRANLIGGKEGNASSWTTNPSVAEAMRHQSKIEGLEEKISPEKFEVIKKEIPLNDVAAIRNTIYPEGFFGNKERSSQYEFIVKNKPQETTTETVRGEDWQNTFDEHLLKNNITETSIYDEKTNRSHKGFSGESDFGHSVVEGGNKGEVLQKLKEHFGSDKSTFNKHKESVQDAIDKGKYQKAISDGTMSPSRAKEIIESSGIKIPKEIIDQTTTETVPKQTVEDIEKRRKKELAAISPLELETVKPLRGHYSEDAIDAFLRRASQHINVSEKDKQAIRDYEKNKKAINDKYDAELAKLKTTPTTTETVPKEEIPKGEFVKVDEFNKNGYQIPSGLKDRGVVELKHLGNDKFDVKLADGKIIKDVLIHKTPTSEIVDNKSILGGSGKTQISFGGKVKEVDFDFKRAAQNVRDNLEAGETGYVKLPSGETYEISRSNKTAKLLPKETIATEKPTIEEPPSIPPPVPVTEGQGETVGGITHAAVDASRKQAGLPEYEGHETVTHEKRMEEARKAIAENPNIHNEIMSKVEKGGKITPQDNAVMAIYKAGLDHELENKPTKETFEKIQRVAKVLDPEGTYAGQLLESRKLFTPNEDNLSSFLLEKQEAQGTKLTENQIKTESEKYNELKEAKEKLEIQLEEEKEQHAKDIAELGLNKAKAKAHKGSKKTDDEYKAERKASVDAAREALKKLRSGEQGLQSAVPGFRELTAIAPHVRDFLQSLANQGVDKLDNIVAEIHSEFKDVLDGLTKRNVLDILAGDFDTKAEQTRNEKANSLRLVKREAQLIKELESARKGEEKAKTEKDKVPHNRRIDELKEKIKEVRRLNKSPEKEVTEGEQLSAHIDRLTKRAEKLSSDIKNKKYLEENKKPPVFQKSRKAHILEDKVIDLENKIRHERSKDEYEKRSKLRKVFDKVMEVLGIRRLVQSAVDISVPFRQGATLISPRRADVWAKGFKANIQSVFSPTKFERIMNDIRKDPEYHDMVKDNVVFNDLGSADPNLHNEDFRKSFIYKIPVLSEPLKASNRSADAFLNVARFEMYKKMRAQLERKGLTRESDPKAFKFIGNWVMSMTGRGKMLDMLENSAAHTVLGNTFYGARLMASRFNLLNPLTYFDPRVSKQARVEAMKDMASFTVTTMAAGLGLAAAGGKISLNPDDSDFLQVRFGNKVYDISGGLANYVRTFLRMTKAAYTKVNGTKYEGKKATEKAGTSALNFFRNKLAPNTGYAVDAFFGKSYGDQFKSSDIYAIYPMYSDDVVKAWKEEGPMALATVLVPNLVGIGYGSYASRGQIDANLEDLLKRNLRSDEMNSEKIKNYKDGGRPINDKEFNEYADKRDAEIEKNLKTLYQNGIGGKQYHDLTPEELKDETSYIKTHATIKVKEEMFGKTKKTHEEQVEDTKLSKERKKLYQ